MSFGGFPQGQPPLPLNPPPPPPMGMIPPGGHQLPNPHFDPSVQMQMMASNPSQPPLPGQGQMHPIQQLQIQQHLQQQIQMMHPAMNDAPLEFNVNKNKPPIPVQNEEQQSQSTGTTTQEDNGKRSEDRNSDRRDRRDRDRRDRERERNNDRDRDRRDRRDRNDRDRDRDERKDRIRERESGQLNKSVEQPIPTTQVGTPAVPTPIAAMNQMIGMNPMMGMMGGMMGMNTMMPMMGGMMGDPSMMGMAGMGQYSMMPGMIGDGSAMIPGDGTMNIMEAGMGGLVPGQKEIIECKECTLIPPSPNAPPPVTRERPPGCKTVFIGGIPDNCTEDIIRDVFGRCGEMQTVRLSKKNFCHIRFVYEASVDAAIFLSGYRMRIGNNTDAPNTGRLHVDYAQARDDQYEYECRQRALQREQRHRERMERERMRPASPPPVAHYSDHEAATVSEKIKTDEGFQKSVQMVITWLERGDCSKRNSNTFYTMIQSTNSHVRRLLNEKMQFEEELQSAKDLHRTRVQGIVLQFGLIEKVFNCASHKKCWDHFTKAQRKNIETWKKQTAEIKQIQLADNLNEEADEEMDVSDNDDDFSNVRKKTKLDKDNENTVLKEENDSLRCQLEAYKNEVDLVRGDLKGDLDAKEKQLKVLQQTVQNLQMQLMDAKRRHVEDDVKIRGMQTRIKSLDAKILENGETESEGKQTEDQVKEDGESKPDIVIPSIVIGDKEARLIGLISTFLHVHPFGAGVDYIWSFLTKLDPVIRPGDVEVIMSRYPTVFRQELSGIGASMERRWVFIGFDNSANM